MIVLEKENIIYSFNLSIKFKNIEWNIKIFSHIINIKMYTMLYVTATANSFHQLRICWFACKFNCKWRFKWWFKWSINDTVALVSCIFHGSSANHFGLSAIVALAIAYVEHCIKKYCHQFITIYANEMICKLIWIQMCVFHVQICYI